jgi:putative MFS transporter
VEIMAVTTASPGAVPAADRLDRLPAGPWLRRIMVVLFLSWLIESYDIGLTGSVLPSLTHQFHLGTGMKSLMSISANIGIVTGIVPAGWLADRLGRKRVLVGGTAAYAVLTFLVGLAPGIGAVIGLRIAGGLAMGAVFPIVFALIVAKALPESPRWYESHGRWIEASAVLDDIEAKVAADLGRELPPALPHPLEDGTEPAPRLTVRDALRTLLGPDLRRGTLMLYVAFGGTFFLFYAVQTFMPTVVHDMGFTLTSSFAFTAVIVGVSLPGKLLEAWVVERWGRKPVIITFTLVAAVAAAAFGFLRGAVPVLIVGCLVSFFGVGVDPAVKVYTAESYPTRLRGVGTASTEGVGRLLSGVVGPFLIPPLLAAAGVGAVFVVVAAAAVVAVAVVAVLGKETGGRNLEASSEAQVVVAGGSRG